MYNPWQQMSPDGFTGPPAPSPSFDAQAELNQLAANGQNQPQAPSPYGLPFMSNPMIDRSQLPDYSGMKLATGNKMSYDRNVMAKHQKTLNKILRMTPDEYNVLRKMAMDITPGVSTDEAGHTMYEQEPVVDVAGNPVYDKTGNPLTKNSETPVYDESKDVVNPEGPYQQQEQGLGTLKKLLQARISGMPVGFDLSPLARLADYESGTHTAEQYKPNNPNWDKMISWADEIQKRRADLNKTVKDNIQSMKSGNVMDFLLAQQADKAINQAGGDKPDRQAMQESMLAHREHGKLMGQLAKDKVLTQELSGYVTQSNALSALTNAKKLNLQTIHDAQQALRRGIQLGSGSQSGIDERAKTYIEGMGFNWDNWLQFVGSEPADIAKNHPLVEAIKDLASIEQKNMQTMFDKRVDALTGGYSWIYNDPRFGDEAATPFDNLKGAFYNAISGHRGQMKQSGPTYTSKPAKTSTVKDELINMMKNTQKSPASPSPAPAPSAPAKPEKSFKDQLLNLMQGGANGR